MNIQDILFHNISQAMPPAFGLDLSDLSLKAAFLKKHKTGIRLENFIRKEIPRGVIKEGEVQKQDELANIIKQAVASIKIKHVVCSLPEQHAFVKIIQLPKMKLAEAREAVKWEAEANIPMSIKEVYLDWQIIKPVVNHLDHLDILINAAPKKLVDSYVEVFKKADLKPAVLEVESVATARSLIKDNITRKPILIIDLGATRTSFIIFSGYALRFTTSIPISNQQMIGVIADKLKIDKDKARELKFKGKAFDVLLPTLNDLVKQINKYIVFHREHAAPHEHGSGGEISKIIFCGGGANLSGLSQFLSQKLKIPVIRGNPWVNILKPPIKEFPGLPYKESLAYTTALGLALRGLNRNA